MGFCGTSGVEPIKKLNVKVLKCRCGIPPWAGLERWNEFEEPNMFAIRCPRCVENICGQPDVIGDVVKLWNAWASRKTDKLSWF